MKTDQATCKLCGAKFRGADEKEMFLHALTIHPLELVQTPAAQSILSGVQGFMRDLGAQLAKKLKGEA